MFLRARHLLLGLALLVPGGFAASQAAEEPPLVAWQELLDHPGRYLGKTVRLHAQFYSRVENWNAFLTRFGSREFSAFQLWSDEQFPWVQAEYEQPRVRLFARRGQPGEWALAGAHAYTRLELRIRVRELFLDLPWAEIESATPTVEEISEGTNIHAARGIELAGQGNLAMARTEFEHALEGLLPEHARAELERLRDACPAAPAPKSGRK
jgi:hypothetical protein